MYLGKRFYPIRPFSKKEKKMDLNECHKAWGLADCPEFQRAELPPQEGSTRPVWNFKDFYEAASAAGVYAYEVFRLGNQQVIPCHNYLAMVNPYCYGKGADYNRTPEDGETPFGPEQVKNPFFGPENQGKKADPDFSSKAVSEYTSLQEWLDNVFIIVSTNPGHNGPAGKQAYIQDKRSMISMTTNPFFLSKEREVLFPTNQQACRSFLSQFYHLFR